MAFQFIRGPELYEVLIPDGGTFVWDMYNHNNCKHLYICMYACMFVLVVSLNQLFILHKSHMHDTNHTTLYHLYLHQIIAN